MLTFLFPRAASSTYYFGMEIHFENLHYKDFVIKLLLRRIHIHRAERKFEFFPARASIDGNDREALISSSLETVPASLFLRREKGGAQSNNLGPPPPPPPREEEKRVNRSVTRLHLLIIGRVRSKSNAPPGTQSYTEIPSRSSHISRRSLSAE